MEQDLRDTVEHKPNVSQECHALVKNANIILKRIHSSIACMTHEIFLLFSISKTSALRLYLLLFSSVQEICEPVGENTEESSDSDQRSRKCDL